MSESPQQPSRNSNKIVQRFCKTHSIGEIFGAIDQAPKRPVLFGNYAVPALPFHARMQWLAKVQRLIAQCAQNHESYPHKLFQVASVMAHIGNECRASREAIAARAGCVVRTVSACINWLEEHGVLTWTHTARRDENRRVVRSTNLYSLILDFTGLRALVTRARRAIWRERKKDASTGNGCPGMTLPSYNTADRFEARRSLAEISRLRQKQLEEEWHSRPSLLRLKHTLAG
jgi:hypothetical protein